MSRTVLLLARSAIAAPPLREMERLRALVAALPGVARAEIAFSEQGTPSLRHALDALVTAGVAELTILPLMLPPEAAFQAWLTRTLARWRAKDSRPWPRILLSRLLPDDATAGSLLADALAVPGQPLSDIAKTAPEGSLVPAHRSRVLVCMGGPCLAAGAEVVWGHLRNEQERLSLRTAGEGCMSAKTSCLGPCNLAPVLQLWPEGTYYGGVDEAGLDRIVAEHVLGGTPVEELAYAPGGRKQSLRPR